MAGRGTKPSAKASTPPGRTHVAVWLSAAAGALSAIVAATALVVHWSSNDGSKARATSTTAADQPIAIQSVTFIAASPPGPAYSFRGHAHLKSDQRVYVVARPVGTAASTPEDWISSPAAKPAKDGAWQTYISRPPLADSSFDFAAVVLTPRPSGGRSALIASQSVQCSRFSTLQSAGPKACGIVAATAVTRHH